MRTFGVRNNWTRVFIFRIRQRLYDVCYTYISFYNETMKIQTDNNNSNNNVIVMYARIDLSLHYGRPVISLSRSSDGRRHALDNTRACSSHVRLKCSKKASRRTTTRATHSCRFKTASFAPGRYAVYYF